MAPPYNVPANARPSARLRPSTLVNTPPAPGRPASPGAQALGDYLVVSVAGDLSLAHHKAGRRPSMPTPHKVALLSALRMVDEVVVGDDLEVG